MRIDSAPINGALLNSTLIGSMMISGMPTDSARMKRKEAAVLFIAVSALFYFC